VLEGVLSVCVWVGVWVCLCLRALLVCLSVLVCGRRMVDALFSLPVCGPAW
jgi:hypothetical protein